MTKKLAVMLILTVLSLSYVLASANTPTVPILLYHCIVDGSIEDDPNVFIDKQNFTAHLQAIKDNGFTPISFNEYSAYRSGQGTMPEKPIIITIDDGYLNNYEVAYPIIKEHQLKTTIFVVTSTVGNMNMRYPHFTWEQAKEMENSGFIDIQSHGHGHVDIPSLPYEEALMDMRLSKYLIEKNLGKKCNVFSYPYGFANAQTVDIGLSAGYSIQCLTGDRESNPPDIPITGLKRITVNGYLSAEQLMETINNSIL